MYLKPQNCTLKMVNFVICILPQLKYKYIHIHKVAREKPDKPNLHGNVNQRMIKENL